MFHGIHVSWIPHHHRDKVLWTLHAIVWDSLGFDVYLSSLIPSSPHPMFTYCMGSTHSELFASVQKCFIFKIVYFLCITCYPVTTLELPFRSQNFAHTLIPPLELSWSLSLSHTGSFSLFNNTSVILHWKCLHGCKSFCNYRHRPCLLCLWDCIAGQSV